MPRFKGQRAGRAQIWNPYTDYNVLHTGMDPWDWAIRFMPNSSFTTALGSQFQLGNTYGAADEAINIATKQLDNYRDSSEVRLAKDGLYSEISRLNEMLYVPPVLGRVPVLSEPPIEPDFDIRKRLQPLIRLNRDYADPQNEKRRQPGLYNTAVSDETEAYLSDLAEAQRLLNRAVKNDDYVEALSVIQEAERNDLLRNLNVQKYNLLALAHEESRDRSEVTFKEGSSISAPLRRTAEGRVLYSSPVKVNLAPQKKEKDKEKEVKIEEF